MRRGGSMGPPSGDPYQSRPSPGGYYYNRSTPGGQPAPSPSHSQQSASSHHPRGVPMSQPIARRSDYRTGSEQMTPRSDHRGPSMGYGNGGSVDQRVDDVTPSYYVEHLATFAVGRQFGLTFPADGIRKLKQMEKNSAIWAQPLILRFRHNAVTVEDDNGELVEQFPLELIEQPTAHVSNDSRETYNNVLLFVVREDRKRMSTPTEMHIFQCIRVSATDVAEDLKNYVQGQFRRVRNGRRTAAPTHLQAQQQQMPFYPPDDASISSETSEMFERDVNTLNRCFDDIERFVARIQSAALAQREIEQQNHRYRTANRRDKKNQQPPDPNGILFMRAQLPLESEFVDILKKFKLSFNLLAKLKNHIHEPNAPELLHFLFTPLAVILEACHWGLGRNVAPTVASPLLSLEARELMQNCLTSHESDIWMSLGEAWRTPPEDWTKPLPPPYRPIFNDGFAPYGVADRAMATPNQIHRGHSAPPEHFRQPPPRERNMVDTLEFDRLTLERERLEFEKAKIMERESRLRHEEKQIEDEKRRMHAEKDLITKETTQPVPPPAAVVTHQPITKRYDPPISISPPPQRNNYSHVKVTVDSDTSPRQQAFIDDIVAKGGKLAVVTYDRGGQNTKELTVHKGEYLEVIFDERNWWECKNMHQRVGYVPHTILSMVPFEQQQYASPNHHNNSSSTGGYNNGHHQGPAQNVYRPPPPPLVSDAGVQVEIRREHVAPPPPPVVIPPPPPPVRTPTMEELLRMQQQQQQKQRKPPVEEPVYQPQPAQRAGLEIWRRNQNPQLIQEVTETVGQHSGDILRPAMQRATRVAINEKSSPEDVTRWLQEKGFSPRVIDLLDGQDGANLFSLSKLHLQQACGRDEGGYLYSQLLVQKKRSGFRTHTGDELKAILNHRRTHVELSNEAAADEPVFTINPIL
ncbi:SH3 domain-containing protein [Caenorhabditis elegans]|nr:SH3 domain-containing protein [Caenorhabditis elegans]AAT37523.1 epidermal growth factor receptor pathway substrate 8 splice variant A [Caenorhabditis elegans]CAJ44243.1 SH3 domain-containing protein [Caenorhabditis elegans]|eukprot:NP_001041047.1 EPS (human endocytosis) related [Caenorhabditis elegans]